MAKLPRTTQKIFGKNAPENQITTFGSIKAGTPVYTQSASQIMNSAFEGGWSEAVEDDYAPYRQDRNAVDTAITQQLGYLFQDGIPEWDAGTTYYKGSVVKVVNGNALTFYKSIADNNTASVNTTASWHKMLEINASNQIVSPTINTPTISGGSMSNGTFSNPTFSGTVTIPLASQSSSTDSTIAASIGWVNNPSLSSNVVHRTGDETVGGTKTFTNDIKRLLSTPDTSAQYPKPFQIKDSSLDFTVNPAYAKYYNYEIFDKNGKEGNQISFRYLSNGNAITAIVAKTRNTDNTGDVNGEITITAQKNGTIFTSAPTPATSDNSTKIATTAFVKSQGYALDNTVVKTSGNQNISGIKTFSDRIMFNGSTGLSYNALSTAAKGTAPSSNVTTSFSFLDSAFSGSYNATISRVQLAYNSDGSTTAKLQAFKPEASSTANSSIAIYYPASGNPYTEAPTPATSDNSTKIATTAFVKAQNYVSQTDLTAVDVVVEYSDGVNGYMKFSNGVIYQWGTTTSASSNTAITLPTPFATTNYSVTITSIGDAGVYQRLVSANTPKTTTGFTTYAGGGAASYNFSWQAIGK